MRKLAMADDPRFLRQWEAYLPSIMLAYNASKQNNTGLAPYTTIYAQVPIVPPESKERFEEAPDFDIPTSETEALLVTELLRRMEVVHRAGLMCAHNMDIAQHRDTQRYKKTHSGTWPPRPPPPLIPGDYVYIRGEASSSLDTNLRKQIYRVVNAKTDTITLEGRDLKQTASHRSNVARVPGENIDPTIVPPANLPCAVCNSPKDDATMLICDARGCPNAIHMRCLQPPLTDLPEDD